MYKNTFIVDNAKIGKDGIFRARARVARIGTQDYNGSIDYRSEEEVKASLPTFDRVPITIDHRGPFVTSSNKKSVLIGYVSNPTYNNGWVEADLAIHDDEGIQKISSTHGYFSAGYDADMVREPGVFVDSMGVQGEKGREYKYDGMQANIRLNHVTITPTPRAGAGATILDSADIKPVSQILDSNIIGVKTKTINPDTTDNMSVIKYDGLTFTVEGSDADKVASIFEKMQNELAASSNATIELDAAKKELDVVNAKADSLTAANESLTEQVNAKLDASDVQAQVSAGVNELLAVWEIAKPILKVDSIDTSLSSVDVRKNTLKAVYGDSMATKIDSASDVYIDALWDSLPTVLEAQSTANQKTDSKEVINEVVAAKEVKTDAKDPLKAARLSYLERRANRKAAK